jgi:hypothetical protein
MRKPGGPPFLASYGGVVLVCVIIWGISCLTTGEFVFPWPRLDAHPARLRPDRPVPPRSGPLILACCWHAGGMGRDEMRAADADRQAVADQLKAALDEGRLDLHEYDERLQQAYAAKTYGDLQPLLGDLPSARVPAPRRPVGANLDATSADLTRRWVTAVWSSWAAVVGITVVVWLVSSLAATDLLYFWPVWVAGPWGAFLVFVTVAGLASGEPRKEAEKRARKQQAKQLKRERKALRADPAAAGEAALPAPKKDEEPG